MYEDATKAGSMSTQRGFRAAVKRCSKSNSTSGARRAISNFAITLYSGYAALCTDNYETSYGLSRGSLKNHVELCAFQWVCSGRCAMLGAAMQGDLQSERGAALFQCMVAG